MLRNLFAVVISTAVLLASCAENPVTGKRELMLISEEQELAIGRDVYPSALWGAEGGGGPLKDRALNAYLRDIVLKIHSLSHRPNLPVEFIIQNSSVPNAWAIPGYVVITRGLLAALGSEAEFAFVIGHEIGHVAARHSASQLTYGMLRQAGLVAAAVTLSREEHADILLEAGAIGSGLALLKYSRQQELEADSLGIRYMTLAGYDPEAAITAHKRLEKAANDYLLSLGKEPKAGRGIEELFSTHPRTEVRIEELRQIIQMNQTKGGRVEEERFLSMTRALRKTNEVYLNYYDPAERAYKQGALESADDLVRKAIALEEGQPSFWTLRGFIALKRNAYDSAREFFHKALGLDAEYQPALKGIGALNYITGRYQEAILSLRDAVSAFPEDIYSRYWLGMSLYKVNRCEEALRQLNMFAEARPRHTEIHGIIGQCYEAIGDVRSAYDEYIMQVKIAPDTEMGVFAAKRLKALRGLVPR